MDVEKKLRLLKTILSSGFRYEFDDNKVLTLTGYWSGKSIKLDFNSISKEMLEELLVDDGEDEYEDEEEV